MNDMPQLLEEVRMRGNIPLAPRHALSFRHHFEALANNRLITRYCPQCERFSFPPAERCQFCHAQGTQWRDLQPVGTLYTKTTMTVLPEAFHPFSPVTVAVIDLREDVRLLAWLIEPALALDSAVQLVVLRFDDGVLLGARQPAG